VGKIKSYAKYQELKFSQDLVSEIAKYINDKLDEKNIKEKKVDRAKILLDAFQEAYELNEDEMDILENLVEFMLIQKYPKEL
jgi:Ser/Thr protein kinase RdoA (MazF antagonist)